jgi:4-alpha-glucanotransferase
LLNPKLEELAKLYGIQTSYLDMRQKPQVASTESVLLALRALGAPVSKMDDVKPALRLRRAELSGTRLEHVIVAWDGKLRPSRILPEGVKPTLILEDGTETPWPPPKRLPMGYHKLNGSLVISAPTRAHFPISKKAWGVFAPVYGLHSKRNGGAGDLADLESLIDWIDELGGQVVSTLPLLSTFLDKPFEPSPYSPVSRMFWNEFYVDPARSPEFPIGSTDRRKPAEKPLVDYRRLMAHKRRVLETMAQSLLSLSGRRRDQFERFKQTNPAVEDYARFRAVTERQEKGWRTWSPRLRRGDIRPGDYEADTLHYHLYAQWLIQEQMEHLSVRTRRSGCLLYLDLPAGLHADGYDTWRHQDLFVKGMSVGAPPDPMFTSGQDWSFPPMNPHAMRTSGHAYTIAMIRNHLRFARLLRIDHVMGLHRLFWIPEGMPGTQGLYVRYPSEEIYAVLSVESHRSDAGIVGENLGLVPPEVNEALTRHNIRQLYIVQSELSVESRKKPLQRPNEGVVASLNTHDMAPFQSFVDGKDIDDRLSLKFLDRKTAAKERKTRDRLRKSLRKFLKRKNVFQGCVEFLGRSEASVVLVNLEDLWNETQPQNVPATTKERPNWRRRLRYSIEQMRDSRHIQKVLHKLGETRNSKS